LHCHINDILLLSYSFSVDFNSVGVYCNEEKTRTFIGLTVAAGHKSLTAAVTILNKCLADFKLPPFYKVLITFLHLYIDIEREKCSYTHKNNILDFTFSQLELQM